MQGMNIIFLVMALLLFVSVVATRLSARLGMPLLLVFLGVGMLAGADGIGGIKFNGYTSTMMLGQLALAIILLDGGLRAQKESFRIGLKPALTLATWGVLVSVLLLGVFAMFWLKVDWRLGFLMAAIVGSTDAAAVFSLLRSSGVRLNARVLSTLELESGLNDPMAILLVEVLISILRAQEQMHWLDIPLMLVQQLGVGLLCGLVAGRSLAFLLTRIRLAEGLYALMIASGGLMVFALSNLLGGSGFLAVYLTGVLIGRARSHATEHVLTVMDGLAWLAQAVMFLVLGLLVSPSRLWAHGVEALAIGAFLILVARPIAVFLSLSWFRYSRREMAYISWVGLRGAVPITLAIMPLMVGVEQALRLFDVAFMVVVLSLLVQGTTISVWAKWLQVVIPAGAEPLASREIWLNKYLSVLLQSFRVHQGSDAEGSHPYAMTRGESFGDGRFFALVREQEAVVVGMNTQMRADDVAWYVLPEDKGEAFAEQFTALSAAEQGFYGEFVVKPEARVGDVTQVYGLKVREQEADLSLLALFRDRFGDVPVAGDRIDMDGVWITVKELDERSEVKWLGLKIPSKEAGG